MTNDRTPVARTELAGLLTEAGQSISGILLAEYPTPASRSYLHPVLGVLSAGPRVVGELTDRLEGFLDEPLPASSIGLFTLASYASALGWLTESLAELTSTVDQICTHVGIPATPPDPAVLAPSPQEEDGEGFDFGFSALELAAIRTAAEAAGLASDEYVQVLSQSLLAAARITDACMEIASGLDEDAKYVLGEATDHVWIGEGPNSLPTLVRSLLARMETTT
ncbi:hypothetical protein G3I60_21260 [Streptomyces sp. SID13666]|uniref:hypothetical protein n=1 Tax=unclassified Streptomyces TaxID=2593676 RepID=UPI0013C2608F|nr:MULTISPECIES: hypothetical protein [unclassified Streptomyces]NEA56595.1 hypothetical protein [Streptomyces sp. SID13666]NEA73039.1 hypothetical protein [Streptomyces sp. SID13588]